MFSNETGNHGNSITVKTQQWFYIYIALLVLYPAKCNPGAILCVQDQVSIGCLAPLREFLITTAFLSNNKMTTCFGMEQKIGRTGYKLKWSKASNYYALVFKFVICVKYYEFDWLYAYL